MAAECRFWYETFDRRGPPAFAGRGLRLCSNCHSAGDDFLLSTFRPNADR